MKIAITGGTGFVGNYLIKELLNQGNSIKAWYRSEESIPEELKDSKYIEWIKGSLDKEDSMDELLNDSEVVIHSAVLRSHAGFQVELENLNSYLSNNLLGSIKLIEKSYQAKKKKFIFLSTCAVYAKILQDRELDENHPLFPNTHYGAYKAAIEAFVSSYASKGFDICSIRPTGIYGIKKELGNSKWYHLVKKIKNNETVEVKRGGKEVHVEDVVKAISLLLNSNTTKGEILNCYDRYISEFDVATMVKRILNSKSKIQGTQKTPQNQINKDKIVSLGMEFGGNDKLSSYLTRLSELA